MSFYIYVYTYILHICIKHIYVYIYILHCIKHIYVLYIYVLYMSFYRRWTLQHWNQEPLKDFISRGTLSDLCLIKNALLSCCGHGLRKIALEASSKRFFFSRLIKI